MSARYTALNRAPDLEEIGRLFSLMTEQPTLRERFLEKLKGTMKDKYRLTDKFLVVAAVLFPDSGDGSVENDFRQFSRMKTIRDSILQGEEFSERDLPVSDLGLLLRKYLLAHALAPKPELNTGARQVKVPPFR